MFIPPNVVLVGAAVLAIFAMAAALGVAWYAGRRHAEAGLAVPGGDGAPMRTGTGTAVGGPGTTPSAGLGSDGVFAPDDATVDRVVRVVSLLFIAATGVVVALSAPTPGWNDVAVYVLLGIGTLFVVSLGDLLPQRLEGRSRYALEAVGAIAFLSLLVGLTGGLQSPFFIGYFLLVGGAALAWDGSGPIALALASALSYAFVGLLLILDRGGTGAVTAQDLTWIAFDMAALLLLAYVGTVAGRAQRRARDAALRLSRYDTLTGLYNRGAFFAAMEREIKRVERSGRGFCLVMMDLDDLKPVNDTFGHPAGDQLLRSITDVVLRTVRATDLAGRYGGDEFVVLLPETDAEGAFVLAEKLRRDISTLSIRVQDRAVRTSVSLGMVAFPDDGRSIEELLSAVDAAMYEAKRRGKNQIVGYTTRTERVATAIGPERPGGPGGRRPVRPDESRAAEVGLTRPSVREESDRPIGAPPYGIGEEAAVGSPTTGIPAAAVPVLPHDEDPLDAAAPAYPDPAGPPAASPGTSPGAGTPPASGRPSQDAARPASMPSLPAQAVRVEATPAPSPAQARTAVPIQPREPAAAGLPPVPPPGAPWSPRPSSRGSNAPRDARKPADRQYVAFPVESDEPPV